MPAKIGSMRALLVMLLFTMLSLQMSAAATVAHSEHVEATLERQSAHHQHTTVPAQHVAAWANGGDGLDLDCGTCHTNCAALVTVIDGPMAELAGKFCGEPVATRLLPPWGARPDRPQWSFPIGSGTIVTVVVRET